MDNLCSNLGTTDRHPRPDFACPAWESLDGEWEFAFDDGDQGISGRWYEKGSFPLRINVPYVYQCGRSGIAEEERRRRHDVLWYRRELAVGRELAGKRILLHFGAVDFDAELWVNGAPAGRHAGGYSPFCFDITEHVVFGGENAVVLRVRDDAFSREQPRGKQSWMPGNFGCWYTGYAGIWQSVWMEALDPAHIESLSVRPDFSGRAAELELGFSGAGENLEWSVEVSARGRKIVSLRGRALQKRVSVRVDLENGAFEQGALFWSPEDPALYDLKAELLRDGRPVDERRSYFGLREICAEDGRLLLNRAPVYQKLVLYQGYYPDGLVTSTDDEEIAADLKMIRRMGFNGLRVHQKIESSRFLYWCDRLGLLVWEEMPSFYSFTQRSMRTLLEEWQAILERDRNHPCIVTWVLFNESWGLPNLSVSAREQAFARAAVELTRAMDGTRPVVDNDGWEHTDATDLVTIHDYGDGARHFESVYGDRERLLCDEASSGYPKYLFGRGQEYRGQPVLITEYGGIAFSGSDGWGYNEKVGSKEEFLRRFRELTGAIRSIPYVCGSCYTQFTDVEQEQNGLLTLDRVPKVDPEEIRKINGGR